MSPEKRKQMMHCMRWRDKNPARQVLVEPHTYNILLTEGNAKVPVIGTSIEDADAAMVTVAQLL